MFINGVCSYRGSSEMSNKSEAYLNANMEILHGKYSLQSKRNSEMDTFRETSEMTAIPVMVGLSIWPAIGTGLAFWYFTDIEGLLLSAIIVVSYFFLVFFSFAICCVCNWLDRNYFSNNIMLSSLISCRARAAWRSHESTSELNQTLPPTYLKLMEEGLPSYQEAVMMGQEMKQDMVSKVEVEVLEEKLDEVKVVEVGTEIAILEEACGEALDEVLEEEVQNMP